MGANLCLLLFQIQDFEDLVVYDVYFNVGGSVMSYFHVKQSWCYVLTITKYLYREGMLQVILGYMQKVLSLSIESKFTVNIST